MAEQIARSHHERWDGDGYPDGLAGDAIPLVARLVAVADVFDVLVHERPYKEAWTVEDAAREIRSERAASSIRTWSPRSTASARAAGPPDWSPARPHSPQVRRGAGDDNGHGAQPFFAVAALTAALALAGCGATTAAPIPRPSARRRPPHDRRPAARRADRRPARRRDRPSRPGSPPRELSHGGPLDARRARRPRRAATASAPAPPARTPTSRPAPTSLPAMADATLCLLNGERADHGLAPLAPNAKLAAAATAYAQDLVAGSYFSHAGRDGSDVLERIDARRLHAARRRLDPRREPRLGHRQPRHARRDHAGLDELRRATATTSFTPTTARSASASWPATPPPPTASGATYATEFGAIESSGRAASRWPPPSPRRTRRVPARRASGRAGTRRRAYRPPGPARQPPAARVAAGPAAGARQRRPRHGPHRHLSLPRDGRAPELRQSARRHLTKGVPMESSEPPPASSIVANRTAATPALIEAVRERAAQGPGSVHAAGAVLRARPAPARRPGGPGQLRGGGDARARAPAARGGGRQPGRADGRRAEPLAAIQDAVNLHGFDELIISTLPTRVSRWLKLDLPHKAAGLGLPVTTVTAQGTERIEAHA